MKVIIGGLSKLGRQYLEQVQGRVLLFDHEMAIQSHLDWMKDRDILYYPLDLKYISMDDLEEISRFLVDHIGEAKVENVIIMSALSDIKSMHTIQLSEWEDVFSVCLTGPVFVVKQLLPYLRKRGNIVAISTVNSLMTHPNRIAYSSSKAALNMWVKNMAVELADKEIYVNGILPGYIYEDVNLDSSLNLAKNNGKQVDRYFLSYQDVINLINYITTVNKGAVNGELIVMDRGFSL